MELPHGTGLAGTAGKGSRWYMPYLSADKSRWEVPVRPPASSLMSHSCLSMKYRQDIIISI